MGKNVLLRDHQGSFFIKLLHIALINSYEKNTSKQRELLKAVKAGNLEKVKYLVKSGCDPDFVTDVLSILPCMLLREHDDIALVQWLVDEEGVDIDNDMAAAYFSIMGYFSAAIFLRKKLDERIENK